MRCTRPVTERAHGQTLFATAPKGYRPVMPDSAPGIDDHPRDLGAELKTLEARVTNLENAQADHVTVEAGEENPGGGGHTDAAPQFEPAIADAEQS